MSESNIQITQGAGTNIDVAAPGGGTTYRQLVAIGDPNATLAAAMANVSNGQLSVGATLYGGVNANVSLQGVPGVNASIQGTVPISGNVGLTGNTTLTAFQGASPWLANASIIGTPGVNASIQGTPVVALAASSSLTAFQGGAPWLANASIVGTPGVNASIQGIPTVNQGTNPWLVNASIVGIPGVNASIQGIVPMSLGANATITVFQGASPWVNNVSIQGTVPVSGNVSIGAVTVNSNSSITSFQGGAPWAVNASIQGTVPVSGFPAAINVSLLSGIMVTLAGNVSIGVTVNSSSSITAYQGGAPWTVNASIQGTVPMSGAFNVSLQGGVSIVGTVPVSGTFWQANQPVTASLIGPVTVTLAGNVSIGTISVAAASSITAFQGGAPWLANVSVIGFPASFNVSLLAPAQVTLSGAVSTNWAQRLDQVNDAITAYLPTGASISAYQGGTWTANVSLQGTAPVSGTFWQANQPVTASISGTVPVSGALNVSLQGNALATGLTAFQAAIASTATQVQLTGKAGTNGFLLYANVSNTRPILFGSSGVNPSMAGIGNGFPVYPGGTGSAAVANSSMIYINGTQGDWVSVLGS